MANNQNEIFSYLSSGKEIKWIQQKRKNDLLIQSEHLKTIKLQNELLEQDKKQRDRFFIHSGRILWPWTIFIITLTLAQFVVKVCFEKEGLSDIQFSAIVATTTATMISSWHILGKSIFPKK